MTDTPVPDVRELASVPLLQALHDLHPRIAGLAGDCHCNLVAEVALDAALPAVEPVIRQQERATTADEIANDLAARANADDLEYWGANEAEVLRRAAAIARSHSTPAQPSNEGDNHG